MFISVDLPAPFWPSSAWHFAPRQLEVDVVVGDDARELLHDPAQFQDWDVVHRGSILTGK